jgi:hypothetical protein
MIYGERLDPGWRVAEKAYNLLERFLTTAM